MDARRVVVSGVLRGDHEVSIVTALRAQDGKVLWLRRLDRVVELSLVGDALVVTEDPGIRTMALDSNTGSEFTPWLEGVHDMLGASEVGDDGIPLPARILDVRGSILLALHTENEKTVVTGWSTSPPAPGTPSWRVALEFGALPGTYDADTGILLVSNGDRSEVLRFDENGSLARPTVLPCGDSRLRPVRLPSGNRAALLWDCSGTTLFPANGEMRWRYEGKEPVLVEGELAEEGWPTREYEFQWLDEVGRLRQKQSILRASTVNVLPVPAGLLVSQVDRVTLFGRDELARWSYAVDFSSVHDAWVVMGSTSTRTLHVAELSTGRIYGSMEAERCLGIAHGAPPVFVGVRSNPPEIFGSVTPVPVTTKSPRANQ